MARNRIPLSDKLHKSFAAKVYWSCTLRLLWTAAPRWTVAWVFLLLVQGILPAISVYLSKLLIDSLTTTVGSGGDWQRVQPTVILLVVTALVMLLMEFLQSLNEWIRAAQSELIQDHIKALIHRQAVSLDLAFYESPEYHDCLDQVRNDAGNRPLVLLENLGSLLQNGITLVAMSAVLTLYSRWLPLILLISTLPAFYLVLRFDRSYHRWWKRMTADRRWAQYYDAMLTSKEAVAEVRLFGLGAHFQSAYQAIRSRLRSQRLLQLRQQNLAKLGASTLALAISCLTFAWIAWQALQGLATIGDLALFYQAFNKGQGVMRAVLGNIGQILTNSLYLGNLFAFLELKANLAEPAKPRSFPAEIKQGIHFQDVSFAYPGSSKKILDSFNFFIPAGKVVAIVGPNGAGKTTLLKLLCRLYDVEEGRIEIDGIDIRDMSIQRLWRQITVLFQEPLPYHATAGESIALGDIDGKPSAAEIENAARNAGAHEVITRLPRGYDTLLGKWFADGVELSGGERQRVAMARAYLRQSPIILLDEPTSFVDSWAEKEWFERFDAMARGRTSLIITHRFTIAMRADIIFVMDEGQIVEFGTHQQLLSQEGLYAQSWKAQMQASFGNLSNNDSLFDKDRAQKTC
jgi:ATP-binding cassette, subfamily B, bacterial